MPPSYATKGSSESSSPTTRPASARRQTLDRYNAAKSAETGTCLPENVAVAADALLSIQTLEDLDAQATERMSHKQVEQHRRLKAKIYFEELRAMLPDVDARSDRNKVLAVAIDHIKDLQGIPIPPGSRASERAGLRGDGDDEDGLMFEMDDTSKMSHNVVEQRRRHLAKGYFDELRTLLTHSQASKFDKNTVLQHTVTLIKMLKKSRRSPQSADSTDSEEHMGAKVDPLRGHFAGKHLSQSPEDVTEFATNFSTPAKSRTSRKRHPEEFWRKSASPVHSSEGDMFEMEMEGDEKEHKRSKRRECECGEMVGECDACSDERACFEALSLLSEVALSVPNTPIMAPSAIAHPHMIQLAPLAPLSV